MAENILHFGGVRFRVNGAGNLKLRMINIDDSISYTILPITMASTPGKEPLRQMNFVSQRARLEIKTEVKDDIMRINRIVIFARPLFFDYPSGDFTP